MLALTDALLNGSASEAEQSSVLLQSGLPRSFLITRERLASRENIVAAGIRDQTRRATTVVSQAMSKARL